MESEIKILKEQRMFKKKIIEKMELQNKRYDKAFKIIQTLIKENENLKKLNLNAPKTKTGKKTKKLSPKKTSVKGTSNNLTELTNNIEITTLFSKYSTALLNVIKFRDLLNDKKKVIKEKINNFLESQEEPNQIILANAILIIEKFINENLDPFIGIPIDKYYFKLLDLLDAILDVIKLEENLKKIEVITSKDLKSKDIFVKKDITKLGDKIEKLKTSDLEGIDKKTILFNVDGKQYNLNNLEEMTRTVKKFSLKKNPILS